MRPRRPLAIFGAYGGVNIGDEMILRAVVKQARLAGYSGRINVVGGPVPPAESLGCDYEPLDLRFVPWRSVGGAMAAVVGRDLFIGGGQLIDGVAGVQNPLLKGGLAAIARATGGRVMIGGVSSANLRSRPVRFCYDKLFRLAHRIVTRDEASLADVVAITPSSASKSESLADLVFSLSDELAGGQPAADRPVIALAVHRTPRMTLTDTEEASALLRRVHLLAKPAHEIVVVAHDLRPDFDLGFAQYLVDRLGIERVTVRALRTTAECVSFYRQARTIISVRMHPIILGACANSFCVPLEGSRKVADMAKRLRVKQWQMQELTALSDAEFRAALGLAGTGPLTGAKEKELMSHQARRVLATLRNNRR